jgi:hypothetical protein
MNFYAMIDSAQHDCTAKELSSLSERLKLAIGSLSESDCITKGLSS